jgi:hypothetical protein
MSIEQRIKEFGVLLAANGIAQVTGLNKIQGDSYYYVKQGALIYAISHAQLMALGLNPSFTPENVLNEVAFNTLSVYVIDSLRLPTTIANMPNLDLNNTTGVIVLNSLLMTLIQEAGFMAESHPDLNVVKRLVTFVRSKLNV